MKKEVRSKIAKKAARKRKRNQAAKKAGKTTNESEEFCAELIQKKKGGKSVLHGLPDFVNVKNGKAVFYEVKPYKIFDHKQHENWNLAAPDDRMLSKAQLESFKQLIELKQKVFIIYYNKETLQKKEVCYTIHRDVGGEKNPRKVTKNMLKDAESSDPDLYFEGEVRK